MLGVFIGSAALIIILSVFNGFEEVILAMYNNFTPQIKIAAKVGKTFSPDNTVYFSRLHQNKALFQYTEVLEEKALVCYGNKQVISTIKGVSDDFLKNRNLDSTIIKGAFVIKENGQPRAVVGATVQSGLSLNINDRLTPLQIYSPRRGTVNAIDPTAEFQQRFIYPAGTFSIQQDFDDIVVTPIAFTRELLDQPGKVSSVELNFKPGTDIDAMQQSIKDSLGDKFTVKNRYEQNTLLFKILSSERWAVFLILTFVLIIAIFNIIGSLTMLVIDKRQDIAILTSLGAGKMLIQGIFFIEGMLIALIGCFSGLVLGLAFCMAQKQFGFIKMDNYGSVIDAYPIALRISDFVLVFFTVIGISVIASAISARLSVKGLDDIKQDL